MATTPTSLAEGDARSQSSRAAPGPTFAGCRSRSGSRRNPRGLRNVTRQVEGSFMRLRSRSTHLKLATVLALALGSGLLIAGCAGSATNSTAESADTTMAAPAPRADFSGLIEIGGGRKIYMTCRGTGSPTVVLVSGLGNAA